MRWPVKLAQWGILAVLWSMLHPARCAAKPVRSTQTAKVDACTQDAACRELSEQGIQKYQVGDFRAALALYQAAYAKYPLARLLYNIGRTQHQLERFTEAEQAYRNFLVQTSDDELRQKAQEFLGQIEQKRAAQQRQINSVPTPNTSAVPTPLATSVTALPSVGERPDMRALNHRDGDSTVPVYKKWWFWTVIGGGVLAITAVALGVGLSQRAQSIPSDANTLRF